MYVSHLGQGAALRASQNLRGRESSKEVTRAIRLFPMAGENGVSWVRPECFAGARRVHLSVRDRIEAELPRARRQRNRRRLCLLGIALLYLLSVPWYRMAEKEAPLVIIGGLPDWVAAALGCYVGVAVLNSLAWIWTPVPDALPSASPNLQHPEEGQPADPADRAQ